MEFLRIEFEKGFNAFFNQRSNILWFLFPRNIKVKNRNEVIQLGKFLNTTYHDTVQKLTGFYSDLVNNPFYVLNDKKPVICTYYNINKDYSSLDPGSKLHMDHFGDESPIRFNRIYDFLLYGFQRIELNNDNTEFGLESNRIEGECYILPNTIIPTEGDSFEVEHIQDSTWLFIVTDVQQDTLQNGSNVYKLTYKLDQLTSAPVQSKIVYNFRMIEVREGTNIARVVRCEDYDIAKIMDEKAVMLKQYYVDLFYDDKVQTFLYVDSMAYRTYDPYMIEFLVRNEVLENGEDSYIHVEHKIFIPNTFGIDYDKTIYRVFEKKQTDKILTCDSSTYLEQILGYGTVFSARFSDYYKAIYGENIKPGFNTACIDQEYLYHMHDNELYTLPEELWKNILVKHFHNGVLTKEEIDSIDRMEFGFTKDMFYLIPLMIYCLEQSIEKVLR